MEVEKGARLLIQIILAQFECYLHFVGRNHRFIYVIYPDTRATLHDNAKSSFAVWWAGEIFDLSGYLRACQQAIGASRWL